MGPALVQTHGIVWAQHWSQNILPIILYGPRAGLNRLGPALVPKYVTNGLAWAQHLPQNMVLMVLYGPGICLKIYSQSSCMGPELAPHSATDGLIWARVLLRVLLWPFPFGLWHYAGSYPSGNCHVDFSRG